MTAAGTPYGAVVERLLAREPETHSLPVLYRFVQALPYRFPGPRDPMQTLRQGWGTCAGKNYLLRELLRAAGVVCHDMIATGDLRRSLPDLPPAVRAIASQGPLPDVHSLLTAAGPAGPVLVDATWDPPLAALGFPVQGDWDGCSDTRLAIVAESLLAVCGGDPSAEKEQVRLRLYRERSADRDRRDRYLAALSVWLEGARADGPR